MFDAGETASSLTAAQKDRLRDIAKAEKALPWRARTDDRLLKLKLIGKMSGVLDEPLAELGDRGWRVLRVLARPR